MKSIYYICALIFLGITLIPTPLLARPVSYPGGWTLMSMNDSHSNMVHMHYSPTSNYSLGYTGGYWRTEEFQTHSLQVNNLLHRWNNPDSQANMYLKSGAGFAYDDKDDQPDRTEPHLFTGFSMDWENRRFFTQYENSYHYSGEIDDDYMEFIQLGVAPYIGEYGDLHTWIMVKVEHMPGEEDKVTVTPLVRFFKGVVLVELGFSENKDVLANFEFRF